MNRYTRNVLIALFLIVFVAGCQVSRQEQTPHPPIRAAVNVPEWWTGLDHEYAAYLAILHVWTELLERSFEIHPDLSDARQGGC